MTARQRPGTASGFIFLSMEDETCISNIIIHPDLYERERLLVSRGKISADRGQATERRQRGPREGFASVTARGQRN